METMFSPPLPPMYYVPFPMASTNLKPGGYKLNYSIVNLLPLSIENDITMKSHKHGLITGIHDISYNEI